MINQKQPTHKILLNINGPPLVKVVTELQSVFRDVTCRNCTTCMERAIKAYRVHSHIINNVPNVHELYYDVLNNKERKKRNTNDLEKNIKQEKSVTAAVTRYTKDRKVFAIEVKETIGDITNCQVYSVKKSLPCDSGSHIISASKRNNSRKSKKVIGNAPVHTEGVSVFSETPESMVAAYKKREADNSHVPESFMPSIEELY